MVSGDSEIGLQTCLGKLRHTGLPGYGFGRSLRTKAMIHNSDPFKELAEEADHLGRLFSYMRGHLRKQERESVLHSKRENVKVPLLCSSRPSLAGRSLLFGRKYE